jgi:electron transfer flavoprotein alpha subunit
LGSDDQDLATKSGLDIECVAVTNPLLDSRIPELFSQAIAEVSKQKKAPMVLLPSTRRGREIAARLAARFGSGCATDVTNLRFSSSDTWKAEGDRLVWGGNGIATVSISAKPSVFTIPLRSYTPYSPPDSSSPKIQEIRVQLKPSQISVVEKRNRQMQAGGMNIKDAEIVVSAGRGFKKQEDLQILEDLASCIGAAVGASRPLTSDLGWLPEERQVGLSGTTVKPKLYIAVGISGQIQHLTGMRDSKVVVVINNDQNAPIFQECDYGVVGDLYRVIPELTKIMKQKLAKQ